MDKYIVGITLTGVMNGRTALYKDGERAIQMEFHRLLRARLKLRYGKIPTSARLARDFSLIAADVAPISHETARKWLRGDVMPHARRLKILCSWLNIDFSHLGEGETPAGKGDARADQLRHRLQQMLAMLDAEALAVVHDTAIGLLTRPGTTAPP